MASGGYSLVAVCELLTIVASLVATTRALALSTWVSVVVVLKFSWPKVGGILPDQGSDPCPLHWQTDSFFFSFFNGLCPLGLPW